MIFYRWQFLCFFIVMSILQGSRAYDYQFDVLHPQWSISKLNGSRSFNDGANCYNATLAAKGYTDFLIYSDQIEMLYFLSHFCTKNEGPPREEDVLVAQRYYIKHAGIRLKAGFVFEKRNVEGSSLARSRFSDTGYNIKNISESSQFDLCRRQQPCSIEAYTCDSSQNVRAQILACELLSKEVGLTEAQKSLQEITLDPNMSLSSAKVLANQVHFVSEKVKEIRGDRDCHAYVLVKAASIVGHLHTLNSDENESWNRLAEKLQLELNSLRKRMERNFLGNEKYKKLLEEAQWLDQPYS